MKAACHRSYPPLDVPAPGLPARQVLGGGGHMCVFCPGCVFCLVSSVQGPVPCLSSVLTVDEVRVQQIIGPHPAPEGNLKCSVQDGICSRVM